MKLACTVAAALLGFATASHAIYRCTVDGAVVYQQAPCPGGATVNTAGAGEANTTSQGAIQARLEVIQAQRAQRVRQAIEERTVFIGMTRDEVMQSWGQPTHVNASLGANGRSEQWVYRIGKRGIRSQYVYLDNGVVSTVQSPN